MKRTRAQQPTKAPEPQDQSAVPADGGNATTKPQRRAKQPRQPNKAGAKKQPAAAATPRGVEGAAAMAVAVAVTSNSNAVASPGPETAPVVPDVCFAADDAHASGAGTGTQGMDWDLDAGAAWWTWGVDEDKLLGWFPFVEEDFRCLAGRAADAAEVAFDDDIWRIHQIYEIPSYAAK
ncbi:hypothetical protein PR202_gb26550 [Eleusine coracana subsp. coracana]|uniref:Uncharacterized protein n=1 Tax=Eleusine coracana subsp. coracana TaxID=191504 RepID=A0AAV5FRH0_ELECO|nr:hypothetical protein QOZ80_1BG0057100 [Eleusine coracana subsp. coracana]GJN37577.1 hypothetical protein PR202_gb26550 [Eleusine coracana subsp. coracana]